MKQYIDLIKNIKQHGKVKHDRTGVGTISLFGHQMRFDLSTTFPLVTTKKVHFKSIVHELLWFIAGDTNISYLNSNGVKIWDEWADENGDLGPVYGKQWRSWEWVQNDDGHVTKHSRDQLQWVINEIKTNPDSRRLIVSAWNLQDLENMALMPCHVMYQFYVINNTLSCQIYQRSADVFLGLPFNIASYALLTNMVAHVCGLKCGELVHTIGDAHIYLNHLNQVNTQLSREPKRLPVIKLNKKIKCIDDFKFDDIELIGYDPAPRIKAPVAV